MTSNWGNYPKIPQAARPYSPGDEVPSSWIPRGMGRCYGDSSLGDEMLSPLRQNRMLSFNDEKGILHCEAGVTFKDLLDTFVSRAWFPPVTPGTKFVSMGGALASDVHGKNHHVEGSFSRHVLGFHLLTAQGEVIYCSKNENTDVFHATAGGMGLTGMILDLYLQLKKIETAYIRLRSIKARNLDEVLQLTEEYQSSTYSVAWIDTLAGKEKLGRSLLLLGEHATVEDLPASKREQPFQIPSHLSLRIPFDFPSFALNRYSIWAFNFLYYHKQLSKEKESLSDYESYFYPLDSLHEWNRIYGKRGFTQYQFALPMKGGREGLKRILSYLQEKKLGSFLSVLKLFGEGEGMLSFPQKGYTLTLNFPISQRLFPILDRLDAMVLEHGGRVYLSKDVRLRAETFEKMYPQLEDFRKIRQRLDPDGRLASYQSKRLGL